MSYPPAKPPYPQRAYEPNNTLAIVGLVMGICNFVMCPMLAPIGLTCSVMALRNPAQQGISIGGIVLNCIGMIFFLFGLLYFVFVIGMFGLAAGAVVTMAPYAETGVAMTRAREVMSREDPLPTEEDGQLLIENDEIKDGWGTLLKYEPDGDTFIIRSAGPDGVFFNDDDMTNDGLRTEGGVDFEEAMEEADFDAGEAFEEAFPEPATAETLE